MSAKQIDSLSEYAVTNYDLAMISASFNNHNQIVSILLSAGANPSVNNSEILIIAVKNGNAELVKMLLLHDPSPGHARVDPNISDGIILEKAVRNGYTDVVKELIDFQIDGNYQCNISADNSVALRLAVLKGHYDIVKILLESKNFDGTPRCDVNAENDDAVRLAIKYKHDAIYNLLLEYGGKSNT